ncbi:S49 family peptidase [Halovulum dunhuangense]|uniref:S49 family peptidase n=1 Tax=Halovulum dunhuangense TaxID=1505036 RepID=A0A849KRG1_9RHOB|nr:S49 family peptidase [Halovulum dunhuangense]NNU79663.1 S49 family peptidase [Halovulum dunhuangense]
MHIRNPLSNRPRVSVLRLEGVIGAGLRRGTSLSDAGLAPMIARAFAGKPVAVALQINSPGGSPVQSALIAARIRRLADEKKIPVLAFCEDVAASGGYWLATAADEIHADANSILGSIGVVSAGFGFHELIARYGIERRVHTAGEDKSLLDPFRPERERDVARLKEIQKVIHDNFIAQVTDRRPRLKQGADLFTGDVFTGAQAVELGLADAIGHLEPVMKARYGDKVRYSVQRPRRGLLSRFGIGASELIAAAEERTLWARYGL